MRPGTRLGTTVHPGPSRRRLRRPTLRHPRPKRPRPRRRAPTPTRPSPPTRPHSPKRAEVADFTATDVQALRRATGAGMLDSKRALETTGGDMEKAKQWLREQGLAGAAT